MRHLLLALLIAPTATPGTCSGLDGAGGTGVPPAPTTTLQIAMCPDTIAVGTLVYCQAGLYDSYGVFQVAVSATWVSSDTTVAKFVPDTATIAQGKDLVLLSGLTPGATRLSAYWNFNDAFKVVQVVAK